MYTKIVKYFHNLKIKYKVFLCMITITTFGLLLISILSYKYFSTMFENNAKSSTRYTLDIATNSLNDEISSILAKTSYFVPSKPMINILKDASNGDTNNYINNYIGIQDGLEGLTQSSKFINNIFIISKNREFFALVNYGLNYNANNYFDWNFTKTEGISLLSLRPSPLSPDNNVIPIVLPISQLNIGTNSFTPMFSGNISDSLATIFISLDGKRVDNYLKEVNKNLKSTLYIADKYGNPISLSKNSSIYKIATSPNVTRNISMQLPFSEFTENTDSDTFLLNSSHISCCDLNIISVVSKKELLSDINIIKTFIFIAWALCFILTLILSLILSQYITKPIVRLMKIVRNIENGFYNTKNINENNDEIGILQRSINSMYDTIQLQIDVIKQEEQEKSQAEIKILAEQINPHFIYNTLECIHWEVLTKNIETSAGMIESLGNFLRISLNYGHNIISIQQELKHTSEYINIMNHRKNQLVDFRYNLDERLEKFNIVKLILQPLAENCIKHGFANDITNGIIFSPYIEINVNLINENRVVIEVSDNGRGFDIDKANECLYKFSTDPDKKINTVGLNNIYKRLRFYYGNSVKIEFMSSPYYKNSVTIDIPYINLDN